MAIWRIFDCQDSSGSWFYEVSYIVTINLNRCTLFQSIRIIFILLLSFIFIFWSKDSAIFTIWYNVLFYDYRFWSSLVNWVVTWYHNITEYLLPNYPLQYIYMVKTFVCLTFSKFLSSPGGFCVPFALDCWNRPCFNL